MSKYEKIVEYIRSLKVGSRISVRGIANDLNVSEGTAYRAIKECDNLGIVTTIPRVGTVRVEKVERKNTETLNYGDIVNIVEGNILGGKNGIYKTLSKFFIAAMTEEAASKFIEKESLVIVGNREELQRFALINNCGVLIVGGFDCSDEIKQLADEKQLPIISSTYDTFTIASIINKAISENIIKKEIILVEDIMTKAHCLKITDKIKRFKQLVKIYKYERYPITDDNDKVIGIVTLRDLKDRVNEEQEIGTIMTKNPIVVLPKTTVAYAAHIMVWENIKMCPVVEKKKIVGVITRQDVIKALQYASRQSRVKETFEDLILENFDLEKLDGKLHCCGEIVPEMLDEFGTASSGALNMLLSTIGVLTIKYENNVNISVDNIVTYFIKPVQMNRTIDIYSTVIGIGRNFCKIEVSMYDKNKELMAKSILSAKMLM
ncbi:DRTGG domain-containing protein [Haloimpatiens sp. FM7330]|uniref:DRTGG domain-containing protein n=1 Tax=Haloimpatiens sp. FM7330 TaxID=3298610 RepID=UPI003640E1E8